MKSSIVNQKINYHIIFHFINKNENKEYIFKNNFFCGIFIKDFIIKLNNDTSKTCIILNHLLEYDDYKIQQFFKSLNNLDISVYRKDKTFRLFKSFKFCENNIYNYCEDLSFIPEIDTNPINSCHFSCGFEIDINNIDLKKDINEKILKFSFCTYSIIDKILLLDINYNIDDLDNKIDFDNYDNKKTIKTPESLRKLNNLFPNIQHSDYSVSKMSKKLYENFRIRYLNSKLLIFSSSSSVERLDNVKRGNNGKYIKCPEMVASYFNILCNGYGEIKYFVPLDIPNMYIFITDCKFCYVKSSWSTEIASKINNENYQQRQEKIFCNIENNENSSNNFNSRIININVHNNNNVYFIVDTDNSILFFNCYNVKCQNILAKTPIYIQFCNESVCRAINERSKFNN